MSCVYLHFIPTDPYHMPEPARREAASDWLRARFPGAGDVSATVHRGVEYADAGGFFERVLCPLCGADCGAWWPDAMGAAYGDEGFRDLNVTTGCCGRPASLNDLRYEPPSGFARFVLSVCDPGDVLHDSEIPALEQIAACPLRRIWQRV